MASGWLFAAPVSAQSAAPPDTPSGHRMTAVLKAFEAGTPAALRSFLSENMAEVSLQEVPVERRVERLTVIVEEQGPLEFTKLIQGAGLDIAFLAHSKKTGDWLEIGMKLEPAPSYRIRAMRFEKTDGPAEAAAPREQPRGSDVRVVESVGALLQKASDAGEFSGVVLIARDGKPIFHKAYGAADRGLGVPNRPDTRFNLGSINKVFTQVAIGQLAEAGRLDFSDTIRKHLPDYPLPSPAADRITIQQLLTMSSGLGDFFGPAFDATPKNRLRTLADYLPLFAKEPLLFEPGTSRRYSNAGYIVLGLILEKVMGQSYFDYVRKHVFEPAGMKDTDSFELDAIVPNRATGYTLEDENGKPLASAAPTSTSCRPAEARPAAGTRPPRTCCASTSRCAAKSSFRPITPTGSSRTWRRLRRRPAARQAPALPASARAGADSRAGPRASTRSRRSTSTPDTPWSSCPTTTPRRRRTS